MDDDASEELIDYEDMEIECARERLGSDEGEDGEISSDIGDGARAKPTTTKGGQGTTSDPSYVELSREELRCAEHVCRAIDEPKKHLIRILIHALGRDAASAALKETLRIEKQGGSLYEEGREGSGVWKRRTKAGCFLHCLKRDGDAGKIAKAFARSKEVDKALKKQKSNAALGKFARPARAILQKN